MKVVIPLCGTCSRKWRKNVFLQKLVAALNAFLELRQNTASYLRILARRDELEYPFLFLLTKSRLCRAFWRCCRSFCRLKKQHCRVSRLLLFRLLSELCLCGALFSPLRFHNQKRVLRDSGLNFKRFKNDDLFLKITRLRIMMFDNGTTRAFCINRGLQISSQSAFLKKVFARYIFKLIHAR